MQLAHGESPAPRLLCLWVPSSHLRHGLPGASALGNVASAVPCISVHQTSGESRCRLHALNVDEHFLESQPIAISSTKSMFNSSSNIIRIYSHRYFLGFCRYEMAESYSSFRVCFLLCCVLKPIPHRYGSRGSKGGWGCLGESERPVQASAQESPSSLGFQAKEGGSRTLESQRFPLPWEAWSNCGIQESWLCLRPTRCPRAGCKGPSFQISAGFHTVCLHPAVTF